MELQLQLASQNSKFDADAAEPESTERLLRFAGDAGSPTEDEVQSQVPPICELIAAHVAAKVAFWL